MNCCRVHNLLSAYIDGELTGAEQLAIRDHLRLCGSCGCEHESLIGTKRLLSTMCVRSPKSDFEMKLMEAIAREETRKPWYWRLISEWHVIPIAQRYRMVALGATALALFTIYLLSPYRIKTLAVGVNHAAYAGGTKFEPMTPAYVREALIQHNPSENAPVSLMPVSYEPVNSPGR